MSVTYQSHRLLFVLVGLLGAALAGGAAWLAGRDWNAPIPVVGRLAPDFELTSTAGKAVRLSDLRGRVVLIGWWAMGCRYCKEDVPHLQRLADKYGPRGLTVVLVNGWNEDPAEVREWAAATGFTPTVLTMGQDAAAKYGVVGYPSTTLLDREGRFIAHPDAMNPFDTAETEAEIEKALK